MMALTIEQNVTIDVLNPRRNIIHVVQEDSTRVIRLTLLANNLPYNVEATETETVLKFVEFRKSDGHGGMYDTTSTGETAVQLEDINVPNIWLIALDGQCFTFPGWTQINIRFETESGRRIHTFPIMVDVEPTASSDTESTDWGALNSIADLRAAVAAMWENRFSINAKMALLKFLRNTDYFKDEHAHEYYDELEAALFQTAEIASISAVFDQGSAVIYDTDDLDTLRQYLTVTATYEDMSTEEITAYILSGDLTEGTSTITVSYAGKTATFDVAVTQDPIPSGYVRDGLIFFLDGKQLVDIANGTWTDVVGGKTFALTDCILGADGVKFNGSSSHGDYQGAISSDWQNETIEAALSEFTTGKVIFAQPSDGANVGISLALGSGSNPAFAIGFTGASETARYFTGATRTKGTISINASRAVYRGASNSTTFTTTWAPCEGGITCIGAKITSGAYTSFYGKTIHAIRIYNRKLSADEMIQNQQADEARYGL